MRYFMFFIGVILFNTKLYALGFCTAYEDANGTLDYSSVLADLSNYEECEVAPDVYQIELYDVGFCTSAPTAPTIGSGFDASAENCTSLFANSSGETIDLAVGVSLNMSPDINIPNGTYTHGYVVMKNSFGIKATKTFADSNLISASDGSSSGNICWSASNSSNESSYYSTDFDSEIFARANSFVECGNTAGTAEIITDNLDAFEVNDGVGTYTASANVTGGVISAYLTQSTNGLTLVNAIKTADRIVAFVAWTSSVTISDQTSSIDLQFNVSGGSGLHIWSPTGVGTTIDLGGFGSGPFSATIVAN
jgi:hypothetical protein